MFDKKAVKEVFTLALPAVGEMLLYMIVWVFDTMMVGQYGGNIAVSAVGLASEILYTFSNIFITMGISIGITSLVARNIGAGNYSDAEIYASHGLLLGSIISFVISTLIFIFSKYFLILAGASADVLAAGSMFIRITSIGIFFNMLMSLFNAILRAAGNTKTPMYAAAIVIAVNLVLDWILIFGRFGFPALGVKGSAIATLIAQISGFIFILCYYLIYPEIKISLDKMLKLRKKILIEITKLSFPSSLQEAAFDISRLISVFMIMHLGTIAFAADQITTTIESISFMPGWGFAVAATTLVGQKVGARDFNGAKEYSYIAATFAVAIMGIGSIMFLTIPHTLIKAFIIEPDVVKIGVLCLMIASVEQPFMALGMVFAGSLKGAGNTKSPFAVSFASSWFIRLPLMYYVIYILKLSVVYVWWVTAIQWSFEGILMYLLFIREMKKIKNRTT